ncbi:hypothetical protein BOX15_Mlig017322g5, partial [Macrostomum lignano]
SSSSSLSMPVADESEDAEEKLRILQQLLASQDSGAAPAAAAAGAPASRQVAYEPGLCIKTRQDSGGAKLFINLCRSADLPAPPEATDEQLAKLLEDPDSHAARFRVPLSIGEPRAERDHAGSACTAIDVVAHPSLLDRMRASDLYRNFAISLAVEGAEAKHGLSLSRRDLTVLRNKKYVGSIEQQAAQHFVRSGGPPKPFIQEVSGSEATAPQPSSSLSAPSKTPPRPEFRLVQEPPYGSPSHFVCEIRLPLISSAGSLQLQVGGDRLLLTCRSRAYRLDFYLPVCIDQAACCAQFDADSRLLTVTMPVEGGPAA